MKRVRQLSKPPKPAPRQRRCLRRTACRDPPQPRPPSSAPQRSPAAPDRPETRCRTEAARRWCHRRRSRRLGDRPAGVPGESDGAGDDCCDDAEDLADTCRAHKVSLSAPFTRRKGRKAPLSAGPKALPVTAAAKRGAGGGAHHAQSHDHEGVRRESGRVRRSRRPLPHGRRSGPAERLVDHERSRCVVRPNPFR
jgi:hypothetical protein